MKNLESIVMTDFLRTFKPDKNWSIEESNIKKIYLLHKARDLGFVESVPAPKGSSYSPVIRCTIKGRLYVKNNTGS